MFPRANWSFCKHFFLNRVAGRPKKNVNEQQLRQFIALGYKTTQIASLLAVSRPTVYRMMRDFDINPNRYSDLSESQLDQRLSNIKGDHPNIGEVMAAGHLRAQGIKVKRSALRSSLLRVDPNGIAERRRSRLHHRVYDNPCPNYVWHIDGNHKLIRWGIVIHVGIDGFTRLVTFAKASNNNFSSTVFAQFQQAVAQFGRPIRVRSDHGGENVLIWQDMVNQNGPESVIVGSSVRNQRVERFNLDINTNVTRQFSAIFRDLEFQGHLNPSNETDLFCLQYVYGPRINRVLNQFVSAHNHHAISTEGSATPMQLYHAYRHLSELHGASLHSVPNPVVDVQHLLSRPNELPYVEVQDRACPLSPEKFDELRRLIDPLSPSANLGKDVFERTVEFVARSLLE